MRFDVCDVNEKFCRPLNGMCILSYNNEECVTAWYSRTVLISPLSDRNQCYVLSVGGVVLSVFQRANSIICCLDKQGSLYELEHVKNEEDVDIFDSSAEEDDFSGSFIKSFVLKFKIQNVINVSALSCGLIVIKQEKERLLFDLYEANSSNSYTKILCNELSKVSRCFTGDYIVKVFKLAHFTSDLSEQLLRSSTKQLVDIVFIGFPSGNLYCVAISACGAVLCKPWLLYSSAFSIHGVICITQKESKLISKVCVILDYGMIVLVSSHISKKLHYNIIHVPCTTPNVICEAGDSFIIGDSRDLWHCTFEDNLQINVKLIGVKGACFIDKCNDQVLLVTFHNIFYFLSFREGRKSKEISNNIININDVSLSLRKCLEQIEVYRQKIAHENNIISAFNVASQYSMFRKKISFKISVQSLNDTTVEKCMNIFSSDSFCNLLMRNRCLGDMYSITVILSNESDIEFLPTVWSALISVTADSKTTQKIEKLEHPFASNSSLPVSICASIPKPYLGVSLSIIFVCELSEFQSGTRGVPWLSIPIITKSLGVDLFLKKTNDMKNNCDSCNDVLFNILRKKGAKYPSKITEDSVNPSLSQNYFYEFKVWRDTDVSTLWTMILELDTMEPSEHGFKNKYKAKNGTKFCVYVGMYKIEFVLANSYVRVYSQNPLVLFAIKQIILDKWFTISCDGQYSFPNSIIARSLLYKEKLKVEKISEGVLAFTEFKKAWRYFVSEHLLI